MHMHIDEAWHETRPCQVDNLGTCSACATALGPIHVMRPRSTATAISGCGSICSEPSRTVALINNVGRSAEAISSSSLAINLNICPLSPGTTGLLRTYRLTGGREGREDEQTSAAMLRSFQQNVLIYNSKLGFEPPDVTDRDFQSCVQPLSQSVTGRPVFSRQMLQIEIFRQPPTFRLDL